MRWLCIEAARQLAVDLELVSLLNEWRTIFGNPYLKTVNFALGEMALVDSADNPTGDDAWGAGRLDARTAFANGLIGE